MAQLNDETLASMDGKSKDEVSKTCTILHPFCVYIKCANKS